ncbi:MAG: hypothetical protein U0X20_31165 [Caldilineaceae bacterium]
MSIGDTASANAKATWTLTTSVRRNFAVRHLSSAAYFSQLAAQIERENDGKPLGPFFDEILAHSTACVMTSVAALEAFANEMFIDHQHCFPDVDGRLFEKLWSFYEAKPLLEKFQFAMFLRHTPELNRGENPYQAVNALIELRNALVHFKPEWDSERVRHGRIAKLLNGHFEPSRYYPGEPLFPLGWVTSNCTKWAVTSCVQFITQFEEQAGIDHRLTNIMKRIVVE